MKLLVALLVGFTLGWNAGLAAGADAAVKGQPFEPERVARPALGFPLPTPMPAVVPEPCPDGIHQACTWPGQPVYVAPTVWNRWETVWHELGHHFDYTRLDDGERGRFRQLADDLRPWRTSPNSPHEKFAVAYAACALNRPSRGGYDYLPSARTHRKVCAFIRRAADIEAAPPSPDNSAAR